ncbi:hypothetical protein B7P43_G06966 [Cryptotermes secundus]|uniref:Ribosomal RNA processing protein 1-like protein n=1 Tax=Cryptotermes secundus TaxID=105785 RepID=A0A2J7QN23_9NEOP|nr:hypothetical protein B7P43_G06966 [Cryptotermes secundus]
MALEKENGLLGARGKFIVVAQEIAFAKILAGNDKTLRERGVRRLGRWLNARSRGKCDFTEDDLMRIWKGLFYCMWMADKPLVQEELAEKISHLVHCFNKTDLAITFIQCFYSTMVTEWNSIDQFRYDKFLMFVRRFLRQTFEFCRKCNWNAEVIQEVCKGFSATILSIQPSVTSEQPGSLVMHFCDIYLQELSKVSRGELPVDMLTTFLHPFICYLAEQENGRLRNKVESDIFHYLVKQSDAGLELEEIRRAWAQAHSDGGREGRDQIEEDDDSDVDSETSVGETVEDGPLDPRAGLVDVQLPQLMFDAEHIAEALQQQSQRCARKKNRNTLKSLAEKFCKLGAGAYPQAAIEHLMKSKPKIERFRLTDKDIYRAALQLTDYEKDVERRRGKKKKHGRKKLNQDVATENDANTAVTGDANKMLILVAGENQNNSTSSVTPTVEVSSDSGVTDECLPKEVVHVGVMESNSEDGQQSKEETEENSCENSVAAPGMKRKCSFLVTELENMDVRLQQLKVRRRESPKSLKAGKDKKNERSKKRPKVSLAAQSSATGTGISVGGEWKVSNVAETTSKPDIAVSSVTPSGKKVNIALSRNSAQGSDQDHTL